MRPIRQSLTAGGFGAPIVLDFRARTTNTTVTVEPNGSTAVLQETYDDPFASTFPASAVWIPVTLDGNGVAILPNNPTAVRANVTAYVAPVTVNVISNLAAMG